MIKFLIITLILRCLFSIMRLLLNFYKVELCRSIRIHYYLFLLQDHFCQKTKQINHQNIKTLIKNCLHNLIRHSFNFSILATVLFLFYFIVHIYSKIYHRKQMKIDIEQDRSITSLRALEPKFQKFSKIPKIKASKSAAKKNLKDENHLGEILRRFKAQKLITNFIKKLSRSVPSQSIPEAPLFFQEMKEQNFLKAAQSKLQEKNGIYLHPALLMIWKFVNIVQIIILIFILSTIIAFSQTAEKSSFQTYRIVSMILFGFDIVLNFIIQRYEKGKSIKNLYELGNFYIKNGFLIDFLSILVINLDFIIKSVTTISLSFVIIFKLYKSIQEFERYQYLYITTNTRERYYRILKVFITNFIIGHFLSILLNIMASMNEEENWYMKINIQNSPWYEKYIWGYYWGTNIMLTVGFGDLSANNYIEALFLIFIQTFSCITLAYNISSVGNIINDLQNSENQRKKLLKTFKHMSTENELSDELETRIVNFIRESFQIKESFLYEEYDALIEKLPSNLQSEYRKEANKSLFQNISFVNLMSKKTLLNLAEKVHRKIAHPEEIIRKKGQLIDFMILEKGQIDFICRNCSTKLNGKAIKNIKVEENGKTKLISLDFIKNKKHKFALKSLNYSVIYYLNREQFESCLKENQFDYQLWCSAKDKDQYLLGQNQIFECEVCKRGERHDPFDCPKLHYLPIKQHIINKYLNSVKKFKMVRHKIKRMHKKNNILRKYKLHLCISQIFLVEKYGQSYIEDITKYKKIFNKIKDKIQRVKTKNYIGKSLKTFIQPYQEQSVVSFLQVKDANYYGCGSLSLEIQSYRGYWNIECDEGYNFPHYMRKYNPDNIDIGFLPHNEFFQI